MSRPTITVARVVDVRRWSTGTRFAVLLVVAALAPMAIIGWAGIRTGRGAVERSQLASVASTAQFSAATLGEYLAGVTGQADQLATQAEVVATLADRSPPPDTVSSVLAASPDFAAVLLIDRQGTVVDARPSAPTGTSYGDQAWFRTALSGSAAVSDVTAGTQPTSLSMFVAVPARPAGSAAVGVVAIEVRADAILWALNRAPQSPGTAVLLANQETVVIGARDRRLRFDALGALEPTAGTALAQQRRYPVGHIESMGIAAFGPTMPGPLGTLTEVSLPGAGAQVMAYDQVGTHDLWVVVAEPRSTFLAPIERLANQILVAGLLIGLGAALAALVIARRVSRPITALTQAAAAVERGEVADEGALERYGHGHSDLSHLARVMSRMAHEVAERERRLRAQVQALKVEIDHERRAKDVADVVDSDFFKDLESRAADMRARAKGRREEST